MGDILDFISSNWYELGSLLFQFAILAVAVSFGRKALRILSAPLVASSIASQAQVELLQDLQKLSDTHVSRPVAQPETHVSRPAAQPEAPAYGGIGRMLSPMPSAPAVSRAAVAESHAEPVAAFVSASPRREGPSLWQAAVIWLRTPMGSYAAPGQSHAEPAVISHREGPSRWHAVVTWLRTPMGGYHAVPSRRHAS